VQQQQSPVFKNAEKRITMYNQEDKRVRDLFGSKPKPEYTIKLNNEFLDEDD